MNGDDAGEFVWPPHRDSIEQQQLVIDEPRSVVFKSILTLPPDNEYGMELVYRYRELMKITDRRKRAAESYRNRSYYLCLTDKKLSPSDQDTDDLSDGEYYPEEEIRLVIITEIF